MNNSEKRRHKRVPCRKQVYFGDHELLVQGYTKNLSSEGMCVIASKSFTADKSIRIKGQEKVDLPETGTICWTRRISKLAARQTRFETGIRFNVESESYKKFINKLLDDFEPRRHGPRFEKTFKVEYETSNAFMDQCVVEGYTDNISKEGLFIVANQPPAAGRILDVMLHHPETRGSLRIRGRVVNVLNSSKAQTIGADPGFGLEIMSFLDGKEKVYRDYIESLEAHPFLYADQKK